MSVSRFSVRARLAGVVSRAGRSPLEDAIRPIVERLEERRLFSVPATLTATSNPSSPTEVDLSWDNHESSGPYTVQRSSDGGNTFRNVSPQLSTLSFADPSLNPGEGYVYRLVAADDPNSPADSATVTITTPPSLSATPVDAYGSTTISWGQNDVNVATTVLRSTDGGTSYSYWNGGSSSGSTGDTVPSGETYFYQAYSSGYGQTSSPVTLSVAGPISGPSAVLSSSPYTLALAPLSGGMVSNWSVNWGDGSANSSVAGTATSATHTFTTTGQYTITATANNADHSANVLTKSVAVVSRQDIGSPTIAGSSSYAGATFTVTGAGSGFTGTSDQFQFASTPIGGAASVVARVTSQTNTPSTALAGVMLRNDAAAGATFAGVFVTPGSGVVFDWRSSAGGAVSSTAITGVTAPAWVKVIRLGDSFAGYYSADGTTWTQIGTNHTIVLGSTPLGGLAVTSANTATASQATFDNVTVSPAPGLPSGWSDSDIPTPTIHPGGATFDGTTWTVAGGGSGISGTKDSFNFAFQSFSGDGSLVSKVASQADTSTSSRAGLMIRTDTTASSAYAAVLVTPGSGISFQWRPTGGGTTKIVTVPNVVAPVWVKLTRHGNNFSAYYGTDGIRWTQLGTTQSIAMTTALAGMAVTGMASASVGMATFTGFATQAIITTVGSTVPGTGYSVILLDPTASGGLTATGNGQMIVGGTVMVDSGSSSALTANGNANLQAAGFAVHGGGKSEWPSAAEPKPDHERRNGVGPAQRLSSSNARDSLSRGQAHRGLTDDLARYL